MNCARKCYKCKYEWSLSRKYYDYIGDPSFELCSECEERQQKKDEAATRTLKLLESMQLWMEKQDTVANP